MKVLDLRPDAKLLNSNFDGYKLSLQPTPILKLDTVNGVHRVKPDATTEFSFLHSYLFQLQNHLIADPWLANTAYFVDSSFAVTRIGYDSSAGKLRPLVAVFKFAIEKETRPTYNAEVKFISEKYALISDGADALLLAETGDRQRSDEWKRIESLKPLDGASFILVDAKFTLEKGEKVIHCLLLRIEHVEEKFHNILEWITLREDVSTKKWSKIAQRTLRGTGSLSYVSLDVHCSSVVYASNRDLKFVFDSVNEIVEEELKEEKEKNFELEWTQNDEKISVKFTKVSMDGVYEVKSLANHLEVKCDEQTLVNSDLFAEIDNEKTTWTLESDHLLVSLVKKNPDLAWTFLFPSGPAESYQQQQQINEPPVADLNAQMEECDFGDEGEAGEEFFIERIEANTHKASHKVFLGSNHPLFGRTLRAGYPKAIAIRCDVDCCLWLQHQLTPSDEWTLKHEGTLNAFGYVQASKRDRKFLMCSPDTDLAVICESSRHVFVYKNSYSTASGLRKRVGPQLQIGQQKVVSLDGTHGDIIGMSVENDVVLLLTEQAVLCLQLAEEE